ncbi:MAG: vitamin K epoxide reductase family protein [Myxococcales bacterium]|jgi:protein-disulfide isomerase
MEATPTSQERKAGWKLWAGMLVFGLAGLGVAIELTVLHVRVHLDPAFRSFCAINETVNCDTVAQSPYSVFLGVPVSVWGILGYLAMSGVAIAAFLLKQRGRDVLAGMMLALTSFSVCMSLVLGGISTFKLKCFCLLCMFTYGINLVLLVLSLLEAKRWGVAPSVRAALGFASDEWKRVLPVGVFGSVAVVALLAFYPAYWAAPSHADVNLPTGTDAFGDPWIGAKEPKLTIIEYSDYQCPHCRRGHDEMRALLAKHPSEVRLVHRHYPLDEACNPKIKSRFHPNACEYAKMSVCAGEQGKFWEANDYLFENGRQESPITPSALAKAVQAAPGKLEACMKSSAAQSRVDGNIQEGIRRGIQGTPSFQVGDKVYPGRLPPEVIDSFLSPAK